ncbi:putative phage tail tape measure protein [Streptomyces sp. NBRC 110611]|uniref:phage tail tape measure protein n=1 Tax=Streptomyces sp. NBRC 110611 TaxID=1621259 RepID=UPI0008352CBE|nr:phage tail tape measure protein [Streptomyces sp. NBRC 110611]GAU67688.1 putative phage tail tape measure protein [Streptomyces sp. NBRC 110611]
MALRVGELAATITVDASGATQGVARARAAMQSGGDQIAATADRAGRQAGNNLGNGVTEGADRGGNRAAEALQKGLKKLGALAVGLAIGTALVGGIGQALEQSKVPGQLQAQLGTSGPVAAKYGKVAGQLYSGAVVDSVQDGAEVLKGIARNGLLPPEATEQQISTMGRRVADTAAVMGEDVSAVTRSVGQMMRTGLAQSADEAMDVLVRGTQRGGNAAEDLLDTFTEYSTQFRNMGLSGQQAMGLIQQGLKGGARDADVVADAIKEFSIEAVKGGDGVRKGLEELKLPADDLFEAFGKGGTEAFQAFDTVTDKLRAVRDPVERNAIAMDLFGTKSEDLARALYTLDPSSAVKALGDVRGAADGAGNAMRDNAATKVEMFKRRLMQGVVEVLGTYVVPAIETLVNWLGDGGLGRAFKATSGFISEHSTALSIGAGVITTLMLPTLVTLATQATTTGAAVVTSWATQTAAGATAGARFVVTNATILAGWAAQGGAAVATGARVVGAWVLMGAQSLIQAARMAAAWVMAMGPVGWIITAVVGLVALIIAKWDTIKSATAAAWDWIWGKIKGVAQFLVDLFLNFTLVGIIIKHWDSIKAGTARVWNAIVDWVKGIPQHIVDFFLNWTLVGLIIKHWSAIKDGTKRKASEMLDWVRGLPGRIVGYFGDFGSMLYGKGKDLIMGLWNGIKAMGSWLRSTLMGWARDLIPGPIARALGIHSPSRVMRDQIGRHIPSGIVEGIKAGAPAVDRTMRNLVAVPSAPQFATAGSTPAGAAFAAPSPAVHIENWHAGSATAEQTAAALAWHAKGRG